MGFIRLQDVGLPVDLNREGRNSKEVLMTSLIIVYCYKNRVCIIIYNYTIIKYK
jgi:hypothetical protein